MMADEHNNKSTMGRTGARVLLIASFVFLVVLNILANTGIMNGTTAEQVSAEYATYITPEGYAFSIWGLIWSFIAVFVIYFTVKSAALDALSWKAIIAFVVNCVACGMWTTLFCYKLILIAFIDILIVAASTAYLYMIFYPGRTSAFPVLTASYWCRGVAWSLQLGWISVASLLNFYMVFIEYKIGTAPAAQDAISVLFLAFAGLIGLIMIFRHEDILTVFVLLWAFVAIAVKHSSNDVVLGTVLVIGGAFVGLIVFTIVRRVIRGKTSADYANLTSEKSVNDNNL